MKRMAVKREGIIVESMEEKSIYNTLWKIYYWTAYSGKEKQWLIFLPGLTWGADHRLFEKQTEALRKDYNCMVWDAPHMENPVTYTVFYYGGYGRLSETDF